MCPTSWTANKLACLSLLLQTLVMLMAFPIASLADVASRSPSYGTGYKRNLNVSLMNAIVLRKNAKFRGRMQNFCKQTQSFLGECNTFESKHQVSLMNAIILQEKAKFLGGMQKFCDRMQSFSGECNRFVKE